MNANQMNVNQRKQFFRILLLLLVLGLSVYLFLIRDQIQQLEEYGYPGIFVFNLLSSATLILPVPGVAVTSLMGAVFNPFWVALAAGSGAALGELSGYLAGFSGQVVVERTPIYQRVEGWMKKYGEIAVLFLAFVPNPFFDIAGVMAGAMRMPVWRFLIFCWFGKIVKMLLFAYGGAGILRLIPQ
jgi:uncharacterized membrane protein YdjX (TVP38/TMEM64 family)